VQCRYCRGTGGVEADGGGAVRGDGPVATGVLGGGRTDAGDWGIPRVDDGLAPLKAGLGPDDISRVPTGPTVGVLTAVTGGFYFGRLLTGLGRATASAGGRTIAIQTVEATRHRGEEMSLCPAPYSRRVGWDLIDAFVAISTSADEEYLRQIRATGKPLVLVSLDGDAMSCPWVVPDNAGGTDQVVEHLLGHGHRRIAFAGNLLQSDMQERYEGYRQALLRHGIEPDPGLVISAVDNMAAGGESIGRQLLEWTTPPTAVVAATDSNAVALIAVLRQGGVKVPDQVAVAGFDDSFEAGRNNPPLTTVDVHFDRLGELAGHLALRRLAGEEVPPGRYTGPCSLVIRRSCGCTAADSVTVAAVPRAVPRTQLTQALEAVLGLDAGTAPETHRRLATAVDALARAVSLGPGDEDRRVSVARAADELSELATGHEATIRVVNCLRTVLSDLPGGHDVPALVLEFALTLFSRAQDRETRFRLAAHEFLSSQQDVNATLLRSDEDPANLAWMRWTVINFACLGRRDEHGIMTVTGVRGHDPDLLGVGVPEGQFPPSAYLDSAVVPPGHALHLLEVRAGSRPWGTLCAVHPIDVESPDGREAVNHWAAELGIALQHKQQRDELAAAHDRLSELAESLRISEERYVLAAQAAEEGLWDWDVTTDVVYLSEGWLDALGLSTASPTLDDLLSRVHPEDAPALRAALQSCVTRHGPALSAEFRMIAGSGTERWTACRGLAVPGENGRIVRVVGSIADIDARRRREEQLRQGAFHDELTGLANRRLFRQRLGELLQGPGGPQRFAVLFCDLDGFKQVNDRLGHTVGDRLLREVANRISALLRSEDLVARLGGDEFAVLIADAGRSAPLDKIVARLQSEVSAPYRINGHEVTIGISIGVSTCTGDARDAEEILHAADVAMYQVKQQRRG